MRLPRLRPLTLTARLVAVVVLLVAAVAAMLVVAMSVSTHAFLEHQLDERIDEVGRSLSWQPPGRGPSGPGELGNQEPGTLVYQNRTGVVLGAGFASSMRLDDEQVQAVAFDGTKSRWNVNIPRLGPYRLHLVEHADGALVVGLPTREVDESVAYLGRWGVGLTIFGTASAAAGGLVLVRRQLAPLREVAATAHRVAELPLASGDIEMAERVPDRLTDERTEIGQVGSALNAMLDHVEDSLGQRHRSEQQVRQFVADASHELRTPLATIAGYTELARHRPETSGTALDKVETESARMTALVEDLLLLARLDSGRPLEREPVDLSRLLLEAVDDARVVDAERSWRLSLPDEPITVIGDDARLHQVVSNLLTNARTHTPTGSTVTVTATREGFTVHDDGPGFAPDLAPHAFERFTRGDVARTRGGAGLGLSLVQAIVAAQGGSVDLVSSPGDTTITVALPSPLP